MSGFVALVEGEDNLHTIREDPPADHPNIFVHRGTRKILLAAD